MSDRSQSTNQLTMKLNGTLDAAVNGGLRLYEVFFTDEYQQQYPEHASKTKQLRKAMQELVRSILLTYSVTLFTTHTESLFCIVCIEWVFHAFVL